MGLISFGIITKVHGLAGEIKLSPHSRMLDSFTTLTRIFIEDKSSETPLEYNIVNFRFHKNTAILELQGVDTIEDAQRLIGLEVFAQQGELGELEEDEYYWFELIGLEAYTDEGSYLGKVEDLIDRSIQSLLVIKDGRKEILIPMTEPIVKEINMEEGKIIITPVKGMLE